MIVGEATDSSWAALLSSSSGRLVHRAGVLACQLASSCVGTINAAVVAANSPAPSRDRHVS